jgi:3-hydroxybutyryl-CoA dehydrogenase
MGHPGTDTAVFDGLLEFAEEIGLVPIPIRKEQSGYIINSLLVPWCTAALELLVRGVSDVQSIDRTWMITLRSGMGPFGMMDRMGLGVVHHVAELLGETTPNTQALVSARYLSEHFIEKGHLGVASGQGFYRYPNPAFEQPGFIDGPAHPQRSHDNDKATSPVQASVSETESFAPTKKEQSDGGHR